MAVRENHDRQQQPDRAGTLLIASPYAAGTPFARSVVLLLKDRKQGVLGAFLDNRLRESLCNMKQQVRSRRLPAGLPIPIRVRLGMKAWTPGELEEELARGLWLTSPFLPDVIFTPGDLWADMVRAVGRSVLEDALHIDTRRVNASLN